MHVAPIDESPGDPHGLLTETVDRQTIKLAQRWTIRHRVEIDSRVLMPGTVAVTGAGPAGRLAWQLAQLGATVRIEPRHRIDVDACRGCGRPDEVHCPGCQACRPGYACSPLCDLGPEELDAAVQRSEDWQRADPGR